MLQNLLLYGVLLKKLKEKERIHILFCYCTPIYRIVGMIGGNKVWRIAYQKWLAKKVWRMRCAAY